MAKTAVELSEAKAHFEKLSQLIREGKVITLCEDSRPVAEIRPLPRHLEGQPKGRRPFGLARGTFDVPADFGQANAEIDRMFYGEPK